jgi:hypothetical protein
MRPAEWIDHPFADTLKEWEKGVPVDCGKPWSKETIITAVARGPHRSALTPEAIQLVHEDVDYQVGAGFSEIVMWDDIKEHLHVNFKVSPLAVIPQTNRRGRLILDLSFGVYADGKSRRGVLLQESVNDSTKRLAPWEPVQELGNVLPRIFDFMATTDPADVIHFAKIDLSDGFWRMIVKEDQCHNFCYVLPDPPGHPIRIVIPHALQMGWTESPGYFCAVTETGRDIIQKLVDANAVLGKHPLEHYMVPERSPKRQRQGAPRRQMAACFMDDHCRLGSGVP